MKKYIISAALILVLAGYIVIRHHNSDDALIPVISNTQSNADSGQNSVPSETTNPNSGSTGSNSGSGGTTTSGQYKDGTYTGSVEDAFYGNLQVAATISGGKITDVTFLQYPNDRPESRQVNGASNPLLRQEAISSQSANVDIVSGATQSSEAFRLSMATALHQAQL